MLDILNPYKYWLSFFLLKFELFICLTFSFLSFMSLTHLSVWVHPILTDFFSYIFLSMKSLFSDFYLLIKLPFGFSFQVLCFPLLEVPFLWKIFLLVSIMVSWSFIFKLSFCLFKSICIIPLVPEVITGQLCPLPSAESSSCVLSFCLVTHTHTLTHFPWNIIFWNSWRAMFLQEDFLVPGS